MRAQLTLEGMLLLGGALGCFWLVVTLLVRRHAQRTGVRRDAAPTRAEPQT